MISRRLRILIDKLLKGQASAEEAAAVHDWYDAVNDGIDEEEVVVTDRPDTAEEIKQRIFSNIKASIRQPAPVVNIQRQQPGWWQVAAAAAGVICIAGVAYLQVSKSKPAALATRQQPAEQVLPGSNKAILTLADNSFVELDRSKAGDHIQQQGALVVNNAGKLRYNVTGSQTTQPQYNLLTTPRGGHYELTLSDGTEVWLNSASSIRFPVAFTGAQRQVEITGEAYFEVAKNKAKPFTVTINHKAIVEVLGTHFDIMAYDEEHTIKASLLEGAVKFSNLDDGKPSLLVPGQQANMTESGTINVINNADMEQVLAWKNGVFRFNQTDLATIARSLSRWYDIEVNYSEEVSRRKFDGEISRNVTLSKVLEMLSYAGVKTEFKNNVLDMK